MSFLFPSLLWIGLPLIAAPVLLHLLNLRKQRKVQWAAMDFLIESDQQNRRWVNLREWLLLAARMAAILLVAMMLARPTIVGDLASWFASDRVHHLILLDDSLSMSDQASRQSAWKNAQAVVGSIIENAAKSSRQRVSILRTSEIGDAIVAESTTAIGPAELRSLAAQAEAWVPTQLRSELSSAVAAAASQAQSSTEDEPIVAYVVSDFRSKDVEPAQAFDKAVEELSAATAAVHLAPCVETVSDNVAVTSLKLLPGARVANLELTAEVEVTNFGRSPVKQLVVQLERDLQPLPAADMGDIASGESKTFQFPVRFDGPGEHSLVATIETDAIAADNTRYFATGLPDERKVLLVDGSPGGHEGLSFAAAIKPGGVTTGWRPVRTSISKLATRESLADFAAVLLLDVPRVPTAAALRLKQYAIAGGGVFMALGPSIDRRNYNRTLLGVHSGSLLTIQLDLPSQAPPAIETQSDATGDMVVTDHPLFRVFAGDRNSFLNLIAVNYYHSLVTPEPPAQADATKTIASLRDASPLFLERRLGEGRVIGLLTTVSRPRGAIDGWSNMGLSPVFPVLANELLAYLTAPRLSEPALKVGAAWSNVHGSPSGLQTAQVARVSKPATSLSSVSLEASPKVAGLYRMTTTGANETAKKLLAINIDSRESDLAKPSLQELADRFANNDAVAVTTVEQLLRSDSEQTQASLARIVAAAVLLVLLAEKLLAVQCS
ncbi:MAG: BatA domain-containing protein, partial [Planctomycetota bacterium]